MSSNCIVGQKRAKAQIEAWLKSRRVPHTILISGPPGVGKRRLALELVKAINCRQVSGWACGRCNSCIKVEKLLHPDVHMLLPLQSGREKQDRAAAQEVMRAAVLDYLQRGTAFYHSNVNIARDFIRTLQKDMVYTPVEAPCRIGVIFEAECMHPAGANSLLKILEEPPENAFFILVSALPEKILPTVLSRCQQVALQGLGQAELSAYLQGMDISAENLELAVRLGRGSIQRALQIAAGDLDGMRDSVEQFILAGMRGEDAVYWSLLEEVGSSAERGKLEEFLECCGLYLRDLMLLACGDEAKIACADRRDFLMQVRHSFQLDQLEALAVEVDRALENLWRNVSTNLVLADLWRCLGNCERWSGALSVAGGAQN